MNISVGRQWQADRHQIPVSPLLSSSSSQASSLSLRDPGVVERNRDRCRGPWAGHMQQWIVVWILGSVMSRLSINIIHTMYYLFRNLKKQCKCQSQTKNLKKNIIIHYLKHYLIRRFFLILDTFSLSSFSLYAYTSYFLILNFDSRKSLVYVKLCGVFQGHINSR